MKHMISGTMITLALVLVLALGIAALAESAPSDVPELPAVEDAQTPPEDTAPADSADAAVPAEDNANADALQEALKALMEARQSGRLDDLETELNGYVASGKMTQEQADLILNDCKEREALRNGECPGCGYKFQNNGGMGKGGRMNGGKGGRGGMRGFGGQARMGQNAPGMQAQPGMQTQPDMQGSF